MPRRALTAIEEQHRLPLDTGEAIGCRVRWSARRTLTLQVDARGVHVFAPHGVPLARIQAFVASRSGWLRHHLARRAEAEPPAAAVPATAHGSHFTLLGEPARLRRDAPFRRPRWGMDEDGTRTLLIPAAYSDAQAQHAFTHALETAALPYFTGRVAEYCARLHLAPPPVRLTRARGRWGSCSALSGIRLNIRLIHLSPWLIDYVVAHEVAHLMEMNHSSRFWGVVASLYPDWERARRALRHAAHG